MARNQASDSNAPASRARGMQGRQLEPIRRREVDLGAGEDAERPRPEGGEIEEPRRLGGGDGLEGHARARPLCLRGPRRGRLLAPQLASTMSQRGGAAATAVPGVQFWDAAGGAAKDIHVGHGDDEVLVGVR